MQEVDEDLPESVLTMHDVDVSTRRPYTVELQVEHKSLKMEIDTGVSVSLIPKETFY